MKSVIFISEESRGVGGIFFDDLDDGKQDDLFKFITVSEYYLVFSAHVYIFNLYIYILTALRLTLTACFFYETVVFLCSFCAVCKNQIHK